MEEIAERHWAAITVRRALPGPRSNPSLPWTTTHFGGLPPGATGCCSFFTFATTPGKDLITAGVVGTGAGTVAGRLPALAVVLAVLAAGTWWWFGRHRRSCSCSCSAKAAGEDGCGCRASAAPLKISGLGRG